MLVKVAHGLKLLAFRKNIAVNHRWFLSNLFNLCWFYLGYKYIFSYLSILRLKFFLMDGDHIICQCCGFWWPGNAWSQDISSHDGIFQFQHQNSLYMQGITRLPKLLIKICLLKIFWKNIPKISIETESVSTGEVFIWWAYDRHLIFFCKICINILSSLIHNIH